MPEALVVLKNSGREKSAADWKADCLFFCFSAFATVRLKVNAVKAVLYVGGQVREEETYAEL